MHRHRDSFLKLYIAGPDRAENIGETVSARRALVVAKRRDDGGLGVSDRSSVAKAVFALRVENDRMGNGLWRAAGEKEPIQMNLLENVKSLTFDNASKNYF